MRAMARSASDAADRPYAPDLAPESESLALDVATLREERGSSLVGARVQAATLGGARLPELRLVDVRLERCDLANLDARGASLVRVELRGCRLTGSAWREARLTDVLLSDCRVDLAAFTSARFERVTFDGCRLTQSDMQDVEAESLRLLGCDLSECDLTDARLKRSELRGCELRGLHGVERLRGAGVAWADLIELAPALAATLGIRLLDAEADRP